MGEIVSGWGLRSKGSGTDAGSASTNVVQDAGYGGARYFGKFARAQEVFKTLGPMVADD
jgi:hypothetical protein